MGRPPFLWIVLLTLAAFLGSVSAANFEWMCEKSGAMVVTEPCELTCHCSTGLTQPVGKLVCYDSDTSNVMDNDDACDGIPEPGGDPCEPAVGSCEWLCRFKGSSESHASCEAPSGTPVCDCGSVAELDSKCDVKVNGLSVTSEAAAPYCAGNAPTTTGCPDCPAQWLCVQPADADSGRNPQVCSDPRCACQTGELSFDGLKPVCFQSGNFHSEANYGEGGVIGDACSDAPSLLPGDEECLENSCPWKCTEYGAVDTAVVECDAGNNIFPECVVPNNCGSHTVEAKIVCVDGSDLNTLLSEDKCSGKKPNATDTTHTCQETKGCGRWLCLTPEKPNDPKACEKICGSGCGNGTEEFVYGSPRCVVRGPGGLVNFVKEVEEEPLFCPESNENEKRPELTECSDTDGCAVYCRAPSDTAATPSKCSTSVFEQWSPCKAPDSCGIGEASTHFVCFDERTSESVDMGICTDAGTTAPVDEVSECTIYSGCGSWQCISDDGSLAPCDIICPVGCGTSREVITNGSPVCVYQGVVVSDPDEADVRCPPGNPASPKPDLKECTQTSRCDYYCRHPEASSQGSEGMVPCDDLSAWTTCNALDLCGSGNATTKSLCYDTLAKTLADSAFCVGANIVPVDELRSCTEFSGCGKWRCREDDDQPFSECHAECPEGCGPATEVLNGEPECVKEIDGKWVPTHSELCPSANVEERLPLPQPCNSTSACEWLCMIETNGVLDRKTLQSCTDTHWNPCPTSCTVNSATRFVGCYAAPSGTDEPITMDEDFCLAKTNEAGEPNSRPEDVKTCEDVSECLFSWKCAKTAVDTFTGCDGESTWSTCSESCGQGSSSRVTACYDQHGERRNDHYCTSTRPLEQKSCSGTNCDYVWGCHVGSPVYRSCSDDDNWGECSSSCGTGLKERTASCFTKIKSGTHVLETDSSKCKGSEPSTRSGCSSKAGCSWKFPDWEACPCKSSSSSPNHRMTRKGECQDALGNPGNATLCVEKNGPGEEQRECTGAPVCVAGMTPQWYVATGNSAWSQCVGECGWGIRTRLVDCRYVPDGSKPSESHDVIGDEFCSEASRPDDWGKCNVAASCNHAPPDSGIVSGVCVPAPATRSDMTPLPEKLGLTKGVCQCQNGYYGQMCDTPSTIEDATISPHGANMFFPGVTVKVEWRITSGVNLPITITIRRTNGRSPAVITLIQGSITAPVLVKIPDSIPIGDYLLRVHISEAVYAETFFAVVPACSGVDNDGKSICGQGTCNASTGKCECNKGFTGELCNVDLCTDAQCNVLGTKSCDKDTGTCICNDDYVVGSLRCLTPKSCSTNLKCANNGALVTDESGSCNSCFCHSPWSGPTCEQCPLECHKGIQKDCKECECSLGYTLDSDGKCTCRFIEMKFAFRLSMTPLESSNQDDIIAWRTSLEWDLNVLLNGLNEKTFVARFVSESRVTSGGVKYTMVTLAVRSWCDPRFSVKSIESDGSSFVSQEEAFKSLSARAEWTSSTHEQQRIFSALENLEANDLVMFDAYKAADTFKTQFANRELNSESVLAAAHTPAGIGMFDPGCNSGSACITSLGNGGVMMADPDIPDSGGSEKSGGGGLSTTDLIIVICAVAGGVVLLIIIFVLLARCNGWCCFAAVQRPSQRTSATFQGGQSFDERRRSNRDGKGQSGRSGRSRKKPSTQWDPRDSDMPRTPWNI